jgi:hypothetical protein
MAPLLHLNGTSGQALLHLNRAAAAAIRQAIDALTEASPNARDYYVIDAASFPQARAEHRARVLLLHQILADLDTIGMRIADQLDERERRR